MKEISNKYLIAAILTAFCLGVSSNSAIASAPPTNMDFGGMINNHDMMMMREKQRWQNEQIDIDTFNQKSSETKKGNIKIDSNEIFTEQEKSERIFDKETDKILNEKQEQEQNKKTKHWFRKNRKQNNEEQTSQINNNDIQENEPIAIDNEDTIYIKSVKISESKVFSDFEIQTFLNPIIDKNVTFEQLQDVVNNINYAYAKKGYVTAKAYIPPQTITDNSIKISLLEGLVGSLSISNNKYTSTNYIKKRIKIEEGDVLQIADLEKNIVKFNQYNPGIVLHADLEKSNELGKTDINIKAKEKFPFHMVGLMDNAGRQTIGRLRGGLMLYSDSLFKQRDKLTLGSYVSSHSVTPFADYNLPVNKHDGRVGFLFSSSYSEIAKGPYKMFDISSRSFNYSLYYTHPLIRKHNFELTSYTAANYKQGSTYFADYKINKDQVTSFETALNARLETKKGLWFATQGVYQAFPIFDKDSKYFKYTGSVLRLHDFGHGIVGQFRGMYQFSPNDVMPYIDQIQAGGIATIRGYSEGLLIGRSGYILSAEIIFPFLPKDIPFKKSGEKKKLPFLGRYVKGIFFVDHAGIYPFKGEGPGAMSYNKNDYMISTGMGLRVSLPGDASARLYWGYPLMHNDYERDAKHPRFSFELSLAPDFDKILSLKRKKQQKDNL